MKKNTFTQQNVLLFRVFRIAVLCVAAVCALLRTLDLFLFYDSEIGYYEKGSVLPLIFTVLVSLSVITAFALCVSVFRKRAPDIEQYTVSGKCSAVFAALSFAIVFINNLLSPYSWAEFYRGSSASLLFFIVTALYVLAPALACAYFVLYALEKLKTSLAFGLGIFAIVYFVITLAVSYFNIYVQMNAPEKLASHLCCVCAMLLMLSEIRVMCGVPKNALYLFSVSVSAIALNACALSAIIASFAGALNEGVMTPPPVSCYVFLALGIFAAVRLIMLDPQKAPDTEDIESLENANEIPAESENTFDPDIDKE